MSTLAAIVGQPTQAVLSQEATGEPWESSAPTVGGSAAPWPETTGAALWLRADLSSAVASDGVGEETVTCQISGLTFTQSSAGLRPLYDAAHASFGGQAVWDGDGTQYWASAASTLLDVGAAQALTILVIGAQSSTGDGGFFGQTGSGAGCQLYTRGNGDIRAKAADGTNTRTSQGAISTDAVVSAFRGVMSPSADSSTSYLNGTACTTPSSGTLDAITSWSPYAVFAKRANGTQPVIGQIAEVIAWAGSVPADLADGLTYVNARYGLALAGL